MMNMEKVKIVERQPLNIVAVKVLHMEKDGTNYDLLAIHFKGSFCLGMLGCATNGWLVIEGLNRRAYLFNYQPHDAFYVGEKLSGGKELSDCDIQNIMLLLQKAIPEKDEYDATEDIPRYVEDGEELGSEKGEPVD
jgi:hypothetical protein